MVLITPDAGAIFVRQQFTESGQTDRGGHIDPSSGGKRGELAVVRDDPARRTLRMAQMTRGKAVHGVVFTAMALP